MHRIITATAVAFTLAASLSAVRAQVPGPSDLVNVTGQAVVREGDAIYIGDQPISLYGIDAPRLIQPCVLNGADWPCGVIARDALEALIAGREVSCTQVRDTNLRRRMLVFARCSVAGLDLGAEMVRAGMAMAFREQSRDYAGLEDEAKAAKRGLWQAQKFEPPWLWDRHLTE